MRLTHIFGKRKWNWAEVNKHQAEVHSLSPRSAPGTLYEVLHTHFTAAILDAYGLCILLTASCWGSAYSVLCDHFVYPDCSPPIREGIGKLYFTKVSNFCSQRGRVSKCVFINESTRDHRCQVIINKVNDSFYYIFCNQASTDQLSASCIHSVDHLRQFGRTNGRTTPPRYDTAHNECDMISSW